jgi:hypothetical protein
MSESLWNFMREAHAQVDKKKFLAAGTPDRPNLPTYFFYSAPVLVVKTILSSVSTETTLAWLREDDLLAYRFLGAPWPETRSNATALMNRAIFKPVADVMLMLLEREFGITADTDKMQCVEQFQPLLQTHFLSWVNSAGVAGVAAVFDRLFYGAAFDNAYLVAGGVVFTEKKGRLAYTSVLAFCARGAETEFVDALAKRSYTDTVYFGPMREFGTEVHASASVRNIVTVVEFRWAGWMTLFSLCGDVDPTRIRHQFDAGVYERRRTDAGSYGTAPITRLQLYATENARPVIVAMGRKLMYADYECAVWMHMPAIGAYITIVNRFVPEQDVPEAVLAIDEPGLLRYEIGERQAYNGFGFILGRVFRLDRVRSGDRFSLAVIWGRATDAYLDVVTSRVDGSMYVAARYPIPIHLRDRSKSASAGIVRFVTNEPYGWAVWLLDVYTGDLTGSFWEAENSYAPVPYRASRFDQKHMPDLPLRSTSVIRLQNLMASWNVDA